MPIPSSSLFGAEQLAAQLSFVTHSRPSSASGLFGWNDQGRGVPPGH
jgi:hypothetical protein